MSRAVYIGGFGNGESSAESVAKGVLRERNHEEVDYFTFAQAMHSPETIHRAVKGVDVVTHSAGILALPGSEPRSIESFGAPLLTSVRRLMGRTGFKTIRMHTPGIGVRSAGDILAVARYDRSATAELAAHPLRNLKHLGRIAQTDSVRIGAIARNKGIPTRMGWTEGDEYFQPTLRSFDLAKQHGVDLAVVPDGVHDELVLRPVQALQLQDQAFSRETSDNL